MTITKTSALALAAVLAAGVAHAQDTATTGEEAQPPAQGTQPAEQVQATEEAQPAEGGANVTVIQGDQAQPAEGAQPTEAEVVESEPVEAEPVEAETVVVEEAQPVEAEPVESEAVVVEETEAVEVEQVEVVEQEAPEGQPVEGQIFTQSTDEVLGSTFLEASVQSPDGQTIGDVEDMIMSARGEIAGVVVGVGGFLGIGEKEVAVEFDQIQIVEGEAGDITFVLNATEEQLENAPAFRTRAQVDAEAAAAVPATAGDGVAVTDPVAAPTEGDAVVVPAD